MLLNSKDTQEKLTIKIVYLQLRVKFKFKKTLITIEFEFKTRLHFIDILADQAIFKSFFS